MIYSPPNQIHQFSKKSIFLAGTIDMGSSVDWQNSFIGSFIDFDVDIFNPRRENWDPTWEQKFEVPEFYQQVNWELDALERADMIVLNLLPDSKSPISLLELGLYASSKKIMVCCPDKFYRSGNVKIVCDRYRIPLFEDLSSLISELKRHIYE